jgi:hypothetical protein
MKATCESAKVTRHKLLELASLPQQVRWLELCWVVFWRRQQAKITADQVPPGWVQSLGL